MLPVYKLSETSVTIKVQHDDTIHQGACSEECSQAVRNSNNIINIRSNTVPCFIKCSTASNIYYVCYSIIALILHLSVMS